MLKEFINKKPSKSYDIGLIERTKPQGGLRYHRNCIESGTGFEACIDIEDTPLKLKENWLNNIINPLKKLNILTTLDIADYGNNPINDINKSFFELDDRYDREKQVSDKKKAENNYDNLLDLVDDLENGEVLKKIKLRIFVSSRTQANLNSKITQSLEHLESLGYKPSVKLFNVKNEFDSILRSHREQLMYDSIYSKCIQGEAITIGYPFTYECLHDKYGYYYGSTQDDEPIIWDLFKKDTNRLNFNCLLLGVTGAGKSSLIKNMLVNYVVGNTIRGLDISGEYETIVNALGGKYITLASSGTIINPLEVFRVSEDENLSMSIHMSKLDMFYELLCNDKRQDNKNELQKLLKELYDNFKITTTGNKRVTNLMPYDYPIFDDLLKLIKNKLLKKDSLTEFKIQILESLELNIESLINVYGDIFNKHSSIKNLFNNNLVFFNMKDLSSLKSEIFQAQLFNVLSILFDELVNKGAVQKKLYESGKFQIKDIKKYLILLDEAYRFINTSCPIAVEFINSMLRESRKLFGSLILSLHSIDDIVPDISDNISINLMKTMLSNVQYKIILKQSSSTKEKLNKVFNSEISESLINRVNSLEVGQCILNISQDNNFLFQLALSAKYEKLFKGGI